MKLCFLLVAVVGGCALTVWRLSVAQAPVPAPEQRAQPIHQPNVEYARVGGVSLRLDLAGPGEGEGPFPAVVCLHGGGWVGGERKQMVQTIEALARRGYVAVAPDYRLAPKHRFPAALEDCEAAVRWLRANAKAYRIDPDRIGAVGLAAGGHLACLLGTADKDKGGVQAVVSLSGPTDLTRPVWGKVVVERNLVPFLGGTFEQVPDAYRKASPMARAGRGSAPFLFLHGSADPIVPISQAQDMAEKLRQTGVEARVVPLEGEGHTWRGDALRLSIAHLLDFLDEKLKR